MSRLWTPGGDHGKNTSSGVVEGGGSRGRNEASSILTSLPDSSGLVKPATDNATNMDDDIESMLIGIDGGKNDDSDERKKKKKKKKSTKKKKSKKKPKKIAKKQEEEVGRRIDTIANEKREVKPSKVNNADPIADENLIIGHRITNFDDRKSDAESSEDEIMGEMYKNAASLFSKDVRNSDASLGSHEQVSDGVEQNDTTTAKSVPLRTLVKEDENGLGN
eukprot:g4781.t1